MSRTDSPTYTAAPQAVAHLSAPTDQVPYRTTPDTTPVYRQSKSAVRRMSRTDSPTYTAAPQAVAHLSAPTDQ